MSNLKYCNILLPLILISCSNRAPKADNYQKSDTSAVIELAVHAAFDRHNLPSIDPLMKRYHNGDSILFTSDTSLLLFLPKAIDTLKFQIVTERQIRELIQSESDLSKLPNYLNLRVFERNDSGYYVSLQSLSPIQFGGGGQIGIYIEKQKGSFIVKQTQNSSLN